MRRRSVPLSARCGAFVGACRSSASAAGRNGRASLVASELRRPLDNQAAAPFAWGWFLLHPYSAENAPHYLSGVPLPAAARKVTGALPVWVLPGRGAGAYGERSQ